VIQALRFAVKRFIALDGVIDEVRTFPSGPMKNSTLASADSKTLSDIAASYIAINDRMDSRANGDDSGRFAIESLSAAESGINSAASSLSRTRRHQVWVQAQYRLHR